MQRELIVAGLYPHAKGFGYAFMMGTDFPLAYGSPESSWKDTGKYLSRIEKLLKRWNPDVIVLWTDNRKTSHDNPHREKILEGIQRIAHDMDIEVSAFSRNDIGKAFEPFGAVNRQMVAEKICSWFPILSELMPGPRKVWQGAHYRMPLFDAIALICTYYHSIN